MVALVSGAIAFGGLEPASAAQDAKKAPSQASRNAMPLAPGGAAGIRQAQGSSTNDWILIGGGILIAAGILVLVGAGNGDDTSSTTTGTN